MRLYFHDGQLWTDEGLPIEGIFQIDTLPSPKQGPVQVRVTLVVEAREPMNEFVVGQAIERLTAVIKDD